MLFRSPHAARRNAARFPQLHRELRPQPRHGPGVSAAVSVDQSGAGRPSGCHRGCRRHAGQAGVHHRRRKHRPGDDHCRVRQRQHHQPAQLAAEPALCRRLGGSHGEPLSRPDAAGVVRLPVLQPGFDHRQFADRDRRPRKYAGGGPPGRGIRCAGVGGAAGRTALRSYSKSGQVW